MPYTETQLTKLIEDVEREFTAHLAKAESNELPSLSKAEEEHSDKKPEKEESEKKPEMPEHSEPKGEEKPEGEMKPEMKPEMPPQGEQKPEGMQPAQSGHDYDEEDMEHMKQMYMSMSEPELKAHHDCIAGLMKCGDGMMGKSEGKSEIEDENPVLNSKPHDKGSDLYPDKKNGGIEGAAPHNALGAKSPASDANGAKINKSEFDRRNGGKQEDQALKNTPGAKSPASKADGVQMQKSENTETELLKSERDELLAKNEELKKNFDAVASFLTKLVEKKVAPAGKAITNLDVINKSEGQEEEKSLSKSEIHQVLISKSSDPTLKKSDREAINNYYAEGQVDIKGISHLLK